MLLNLAEPQYFSGYNPYLNWWKVGNLIQVVSSTHGTLFGQPAWDNGTYLDPTTGELKNPVPADVTSISKGIWSQVSNPTFQYEGTSFANFAGQQWDVTWSGCANPTPSVNNLGSGGTSSFGSNSGTFTFGSSGANNVAITFSPNASGCTNNPPTNIKIYQHQYATNVANGELTNPDWRADVKKFGILRLMDWQVINFSGVTDSSQLATLAYSSYNGIMNVAYGDTSSTVSGTVLTIVNNFSQPFQVGMKLVCSLCTNSMTIASLGTGTGNAGTYNLTCTPSCNTVSGVNVLAIPPTGQNGAYGPKGGVGPDIACKVANEAGTGIEYPIPMAATDQYVTDIATALKACTTQLIKFSYGNENWNFAWATFAYMQALAPQTSGIASGMQYSGYRAAKVFDIIQGVYGSNSGGGRWIGALGSFQAISGDTTDVITGANVAINNLSLHTLPQLVGTVDVAPYVGDFIGGAVITNITASTTPIVTATANSLSSVNFTNGQIVKLFVNGGTMGARLNNIYATIGSVTGTTFTLSSFGGSNVDTTGLTYGGSGADQAINATFFRLADQAAALNISTPATYPTKFAYFAQQLSKASINGSATDPSYGTLTVGSAVPGLASGITQHALIANASGLRLGNYEGGNSLSMDNSLSNNPPAQMLEYFIGWQFDLGVTGDTTNTEAGVEAAIGSAMCSFNGGYSIYPAQYTEAGPQSSQGPWGSVRFYPGDESNSKWQGLLAVNAQSACVDPAPAATWTASLPASASNRFFGTPGTNPVTDTLAAAVIGTAATSVKFLISLTGGQVTSVSCDGVTVTVPDVVSTAGGRLAAIYTINVGAGTNTRSCNAIVANGGSQNHEFYVMTVGGLQSTTPVNVNTGSNNVAVPYHKGNLVMGVAACSNGSNSGTTGITPLGGPSTSTQQFAFNDAANTFQLAGYTWPFSASAFNFSDGCVGDLAVAVYH